MIYKLAIIAAFLTAVGGSAVRNTAQGSFNRYFSYARNVGYGLTAIPLPSAQELTADSAISIPSLILARDTIVIVHGLDGDRDSTINPIVRNAFLNERARPDVEVNIIVVDWSTFSKRSYSVASEAVPSVGKALGQYLQLLITQNRINVATLHLIGFNLGAHVVGFAGRELNGLAPRITGLDPSGSGWGSNTPRLSKSDAVYVEVIHTDGGGLLANGIGTAIGDADFFVNGGSNQPGCLTRACSHNRAYELFADTLLRENPLEGNLCNSNLQLSLNACKGQLLDVGGDRLVKRPDGNIYRVNTGRSPPY